MRACEVWLGSSQHTLYMNPFLAANSNGLEFIWRIYGTIETYDFFFFTLWARSGRQSLAVQAKTIQQCGWVSERHHEKGATPNRAHGWPAGTTGTPEEHNSSKQWMVTKRTTSQVGTLQTVAHMTDYVSLPLWGHFPITFERRTYWPGQAQSLGGRPTDRVVLHRPANGRRYQVWTHT